MKKYIAPGMLGLAIWMIHSTWAGEDSAAKAKEGLQALQDYIGKWKGSGASEKDRSSLWRETANWSWRFKKKDVWLNLEFPVAKNFKKGEMRFLPDKELYQLTLIDPKDKKQVFEGKLKRNMLIMERLDPASKETQQLKINMAGGGLRFIYTYSVKPENRTLYYKHYQVAFTKEGESFASSEKKVECVVTGGLGTMPVSYKGVTYYVCCSGCRDAFNENPEKIIKEYLARKKKR